MPAHVNMYNFFFYKYVTVYSVRQYVRGERERERYNVVKDCRLVNHGGTVDALKLLLLMSLHQKMQRGHANNKK